MNRGDEITHAEVQALLVDYTAGELAERELVRVEHHLRHCAVCQRALAEVQRMRALLRLLASSPVQEAASPSSLADAIVEHLPAPGTPREDASGAFDLYDAEWEEDIVLPDENTSYTREPRPLFPLSSVSETDSTGGRSTQNSVNGRYYPDIQESSKERKKSSKREKAMQTIAVPYPQQTNKSVMRPLSVLAAVFVVGLIASSLLTVLNIVRHNGTPPATNTPITSSTAAAPTTPAVKTSSGIYVVTGTNLIKLSTDGKTKIWSKNVPDLGVFIAVAGDRVYAYAQTNQSPVTVYAFSAKDGKQFWESTIKTDVVFSLLATTSTVYANDSNGDVHALRADNGRERWKYSTGAQAVQMTPIVSHKMILEGNVLYGTMMNVFYAIDVRNGQAFWSQKVGDAQSHIILEEPVIADGMIYAVGYDYPKQRSGIYSFRTDGLPGWPWEEDTAKVGQFQQLAVAQGKVFIASASQVYVRDSRTGKELGTLPVQIARYSAPMVMNSTVYIVENGNGQATFNLVAINATENTILWRHEGFTGTMQAVTAAQNVIYVYTTEVNEAGAVTDRIHAFDANGNELWSRVVLSDATSAIKRPSSLLVIP